MNSLETPADLPISKEVILTPLLCDSFSVSSWAINELESIPVSERQEILTTRERQADLELWDRAVETNDLSTLLQIVVRICDTELQEQVQDKINKLQTVEDRETQFRLAQQEERESLGATQELLKEYAAEGDSSLKEAVEAMMALKESQAWETATQEDSAESYKRYLRQSVTGLQADKAKNRIAELQSLDDDLWNKASSPPDFQLVTGYRDAALQTCRQAAHESEAIRLLDKLKEQEDQLTEAAVDINGCKVYLAYAPLQSSLEMIQQRHDQLVKQQHQALAAQVKNEELRLYQLAMEEDHFLGWVRFLQKYPDGDKANVARKMLRAKCDFRFIEGQDCIVKVEGMPEFKMIWCPPGGFRFGYSGNKSSYEVVNFERGFWAGEMMTSERLADSLAFPYPESSLTDAAVGITPGGWDKRLHNFNTLLSSLSSKFVSRFPIASEWEYTCKAGAPGPYPWGELKLSSLNSYLLYWTNGYAAKTDRWKDYSSLSMINEGYRREIEEDRFKQLKTNKYIESLADFKKAFVNLYNRELAKYHPNCWKIYDVCGVSYELVCENGDFALRGWDNPWQTIALEENTFGHRFFVFSN